MKISAVAQKEEKKINKIKYVKKSNNSSKSQNKMTKKISIQIYSDLHIELMKNFPKIEPKAKYLFLVGDICQLNHHLFFKFFDYCSPLWEKIFYTPGNHEFYFKKKNYLILI